MTRVIGLFALVTTHHFQMYRDFLRPVAIITLLISTITFTIYND